MTVASVLTVSSCMLIVSLFYVMVTNIDFFMAQMEGTLGIVVFVDDELPYDQLADLRLDIVGVEGVSVARYVTRSEAFEAMLEQFESPDILAGISPDILPRTFEIELHALHFHDGVVAQLEAMEGVRRVRHGQDVANILLAFSGGVRWVSFVLIFILAAVSIIIITNTIRITVNARRDEINIMKYVGATDWFVRWPFLIEGMLIGVIGSLLPPLAVWFVYPQLVNFVANMPLMEGVIVFRPILDILVYLFPLVIFLGALIGLIGSVSSIRRHLHV